MSTITTSKGKTYEVEYVRVPTHDGGLMIRLNDNRKLAEIAPEFEELEFITLNDGDTETTYEGYNTLREISRTQIGAVKVKLARE